MSQDQLITDEHVRVSDRSASHMLHVRHYYGDHVRVLFVGIAVLIGLVVPFSGTIEFGVLFGGPAIIVLSFLAGFTNPHSRFVLALDAAVSALGVLITEFLAANAYATGNLYAFAALEAMGLLFVIALYFSTKNVRAAFLHQIGQSSSLDEFDEKPPVIR